jgi:putative solute:sodium symporter small subunit
MHRRHPERGGPTVSTRKVPAARHAWGLMNRERQVAYWRASLANIAAILGAWVVVSCVLPVFLADLLDEVRIAGFPLGFWFGQQGAPLVFVLLVAVYVRRMNALDRRYGVYER